MNNRVVVETVILAAIVLVLLPLFGVMAMMASHYVFGMTGMTGVFDSLGFVQAATLLWAALATVIVGALVGLVATSFRHA